MYKSPNANHRNNFENHDKCLFIKTFHSLHHVNLFAWIRCVKQQSITKLFDGNFR